MKRYLFRAVLSSDTGEHVLILPASSKENAKELICINQDCPAIAILRISLIKRIN